MAARTTTIMAMPLRGSSTISQLTATTTSKMTRLLTRRLRQLFNRARPDTNELNILRGILKSVERPKKRTPRVRPGTAPQTGES